LSGTSYLSGLWISRFLGLAVHVAGWSKDPSTKCGAVIADRCKRVVALGFNGFPRSLPDTRYDDRSYKLDTVIHAEQNAVLFARTSLEGCGMFVSKPVCCSCASVIIQAGICEVHMLWDQDMFGRWSSSVKRAFRNLRVAGVKTFVYDSVTFARIDDVGELGP